MTSAPYGLVTMKPGRNVPLRGIADSTKLESEPAGNHT